MVTASRRRGFTWVELLVVIVVLGVFFACVPACINVGRTDHRQGMCMNNLKQLGVALHNHHDANKKFPASCALTGEAEHAEQNGWSWLTYLLPYCEQEVLYQELQLRKNIVPGEKTTPVAFITEMSQFQCPDYSGPRFAFPEKDPPSGALTNYKAMGATHHGSLAQAEGGGGTPPAKYEGDHPDGALYPGVRAKIFSLSDGTSNTVMACETAEQKEAIWCLGSTATLVGLPPSVSYQKLAPLTFWAPTGFNGEYDAAGATSHLLTYLRWDYDDDGPYISKQYRQGPGSEHPGVVNHLFGDGTVHSISKDVDAALYFFIITRANGDPGSEWHEPCE